MGWIDLHFQRSEISEVWLLNTRNSNAVLFQTDKLMMEIFDDENGVIQRKTVAVVPYPNWSSVKLASGTIATRIRLNIIQYSGEGAGLNEIKIRK
jgi:hypothetical protein